LTAGLAWLAVGLVLALIRDLSLAAYLIKIFLPSSPALLDCTELARSHWRHASRREEAEQDIQDLWQAHKADPAAIDVAACRNIQDTAYLLRRHGPRVPETFSRLRKRTTSTAIASGARRLLQEAPEET
jgi:predicted pore-forming effector associated with SMODS systems